MGPPSTSAEKDFEGDFPGYFKGYSRGCFRGRWRGTSNRTWHGRGIFVKLRSGLVRIWSRSGPGLVKVTFNLNLIL